MADELAPQEAKESVSGASSHPTKRPAPMRIAMIVWNEFRNDARVLKEAETLQAAGYAVTVFALHTPGVTEKNEVLSSGVRVIRTARRPFWRLIPPRSQRASSSSAPSGPVQRMSMPRQLARIAFRLWTHMGMLAGMVISRPHVVHSHDVNTLPTGWLAAALSRAHLVYDAHEISTDREGYAGFRGLVGWVEKRLMPRAAATITTTDARAKFFARAYGIPRPLVLQNRPRFVEPVRSDRIRDELGLKEAWPIILYQGGLQQGRGLDRLVNAAASVEHAYFVFIGGGRLAAPLEKQARDMGLAERVRFIPTVSLDDLPSYTASADIGVQPIENTCLNHFTTDSNKLFEYTMAGLPVVASDLPEIRRIVNANDLGVLVPAGDTDQLAQALRKLVSDGEERTRLAGNARQAAAKVNWDEQEHRLVELYRWLSPA